MNRLNTIQPLILISLVLAACAGTRPSTAGSNLTPSGNGRTTLEPAPGPLNELADLAEAQTPILDVYQISLSDEGDLIVFTFMRRSETSSDSEQDIRRATEGIWSAAMEVDIEPKQVSVTFLRTQDVYSLAHGPTQAVWLVGGIRVDWSAIVEYVSGQRTSEVQDTFWNSERILVLPLNQAYAGKPNHPLLQTEE
jgi:hypothetical protein